MCVNYKIRSFSSQLLHVEGSDGIKGRYSPVNSKNFNNANHRKDIDWLHILLWSLMSWKGVSHRTAVLQDVYF